MNNYYNHANIKSPCPNYIDIESLDGRTMPEWWSSDDRRISWHPTATGRSPGSHRWTTCRSPSGHRLKFRSSAKWIGRLPSSHLAVAGRRLVLDFYDPVQGRKNPAMICRCLKTGIGGKSGDHRAILKACDAALKEWDPFSQDLTLNSIVSGIAVDDKVIKFIKPKMLGKVSLILWLGRVYMSCHLSEKGRLLHLHQKHLLLSTMNQCKWIHC